MKLRSRALICALGLTLSASSFALPFVHLVLRQDTAAPAPQKQPVEKRTLKADDYKVWERLGPSQITRDGRWVAFEIARVDADGGVYIRNSDKIDRWEVPNGSRVRFSDDSKFVACIISPPKAAVEKFVEERKPVPTKLSVRNLETGVETIYDDIRAFTFRKDTHQILATRARSDEPTSGTDLIVFDPAGGDPLVVSNASSFRLNKAESFALASVDSGSGYSTIQLVDLNRKSVLTVHHSKEKLLGAGWAGEANAFVYAAAIANEKKEGNNHRLYRVTVSDTGTTQKFEFNPATFAGFPTDQRISELGAIRISDNGAAVAFGTQPWDDKKKPSNPKDRPGVEIWHTKDIRVVPQQKVQSRSDRGRVALHVWRPTESKLELASPLKDGPTSTNAVEVTLLGDDYRTALLVDPKPYESAVTNGIVYEDVSLYDLGSKKTTPVINKVQFGASSSLTGRFVTYYSAKGWWSMDTQSGKAVRLGDANLNFENELDDHYVAVKPPAMPPMWMEEDKAVVLHDLYDAWLADPSSGKVTRLTQGRKEKLQFRYLVVNTFEDHPTVNGPHYFSMFDVVEKNSGVFLSDGKGDGKVLFNNNADVMSVVNCKEADRMMFRMQSFSESPNLYITNRNFTAAKPITKTNPQQADFKWGKTELIKYRSRFGVDLQGTLIYPADYDPAKSYPMVTYIYERLSDEFHAYRGPMDWNAYNAQVLSQNGYFVFEPDIAYKGYTAGQNAVDCLEPAVDAVLRRKVGVDPKKVGLIGHSWGAYQTAFVTTVSDRFAVGACGAPLTELTSMYNSFYWNAGIADQVIFESDQGRAKGPFWEDPKPFIDNSPVWQSAKRKVPILFAFGDNDGAVDWSQGQFFYNTLRRMGKDGVMLVYAGENHGLAKRPNQLDYARRLRHYLDVYLKGEKAEPWVTTGVPLIQQLDK